MGRFGMDRVRVRGCQMHGGVVPSSNRYRSTDSDYEALT